MEQVITALIIITLVLFGALTLAHAFLNTQQEVMLSWQAMQERLGERARTSITPVRGGALGDVVEVTIKNDGGARLADFHKWDVVLQYDSATGRYVDWYLYTQAAEPAQGQWTVRGIYLDASQNAPEVYEPGILDPGEEMVIRIRTAQPAVAGATSVATVGTPNGVSISVAFAG